MTPRYFLLAFLFLSPAIACLAQDNAAADPVAGRISPKELSIPPSPVFDLMGVTPAQVTRVADIKDFKVDWSLKSWAISPNLALEGQPIWELLYNRRRLDKYQHASPFLRHLASIDLSIGTVQNEENDRRIGFAATLNLLKQKDPLMAQTLYADVDSGYQQQVDQLQKQLKQLRTSLDTTTNVLQKAAIRTDIQTAQQSLAELNPRRMQEINRRAALFAQEHWNASSLNIAAGRIYTYQTDSTGSLLKLRLNRNTAWGIWLNGGFGIGHKLLVTGLLRTTWYQEALDFVVHDNQTGKDTTQNAVAANNLYSAGVNLRYGGAIFSFFVEFFYEQKSLRTPVEALRHAFTPAQPGQVIDASSVKWNVVDPNTLNFGGSWRVSRNLVLDYGLRCLFDTHWKIQTFTPVVGIACMMR